MNPNQKKKESEKRMSKKIINGTAYDQRGLEILQMVEQGKMPPPSKDGRRRRACGEHHDLIVGLNSKGFTAKSIHGILSTQCRLRVSLPCVTQYIACLGLRQPNGRRYTNAQNLKKVTIGQ